MIAFLAAVALAGPGYYHPDDLAQQSTVYARAGASADAFAAHERTAEQLSAALHDYELSLDLLGDRAPAAERTRYDELEKSYNRQFAVLQSFTNTMVDDFDGAFMGALGRALKSHPDAVECAAQIATGPAIPGIGGRTKPNPDCKGDDLNAALAKAMDADPQLTKDVDGILARAWPELALPAAPQAPVGTGTRWASPSTLVRKGAPDALKAIDRTDDAARVDLEAAVESGVSPSEREELVKRAQAITAATAASRAALGAPILAAADAALAKWTKKGEPASAWCANPTILGGCTGEDATADLVERLLADKKVQGALP
jgi:hypothetical protein